MGVKPLPWVPSPQVILVALFLPNPEPWGLEYLPSYTNQHSLLAREVLL